MLCRARITADDAKRRNWVLPTIDVVSRDHIRGAGGTEINDKQGIIRSHHTAELPAKLLDLLIVEASPIDRILHAMAVAAHNLVDLAKPSRVADVVADQAPAFVSCHYRNRNFAKSPPSPIHSFSRRRTSSSIIRA